LSRRIDPAGVDTAVERFGHFWVNLAAEAGEAAKGSLDVAARAAKAIIEIEMAEGGVQIVAPHQAHHSPAKPNAFGVARRPVYDLCGFGKFVGLALVLLGGVSRAIGRGFAGLVLGMVSTLGWSACRAEQKDKPGDYEMAQDTDVWPTHPSTHEVPDS
jgi:hypothetical protein